MTCYVMNSDDAAEFVQDARWFVTMHMKGATQDPAVARRALIVLIATLEHAVSGGSLPLRDPPQSADPTIQQILGHLCASAFRAGYLHPDVPLTPLLLGARAALNDLANTFTTH